MSESIYDSRQINPRIEDTEDLVRESDPPDDFPDAPIDPLTKRTRQRRFVTVQRAERFWAEKAYDSPLFFHEYMTDKAPAQHHKIWYANIFNPRVPLLNLIAPRDSAKAQPLSSQVLTPDGFVDMGSLGVGDLVMSGEGVPTKVVAIQKRGKQQVYKVTFTDGSHTRCTDDHLWKVRLLGRKGAEDVYQTLPLCDIKTSRWVGSGGRWGKSIKRAKVYHSEESYLDTRNQARYHIPVVSPIQFTEKEFLLDPYVMGAYLGDGSSRLGTPTITSADDELLEIFANRIPRECSMNPKGKYGWSITTPGKGRGHENIFMTHLKTYGLYRKKSEDKFIPEPYFLGSVEQRLELLQGLLDTDGTVKEGNSTPVYVSISRQLVFDVIRLVRSLGGTASYNTFQPKGGLLAYRTNIKLPRGFAPFKLTRKMNYFVEISKYPLTRGIIKIEANGFEDVQCIVVAYPDHTYVTDDYVVTHNSTVMALSIAWLIGRAPLLTHALISVSAVQAQARLRMVRNMVGENPRYRNTFPYIAIDKRLPDTQNEFSVWSKQHNMSYSSWRSFVSRKGSDKDPTFYAAGATGKGIIGRRISGFFGWDDIIDETMLTVLAQEKMERYIILTCLPCLEPGGKGLYIGTRWMIGDVPQRLIENPAWRSLVLSAIKFDETGKRYSYWPEWWDLERLDLKKFQMNNNILFDIMYMCDPRAMSANLFTMESLSRDVPDPLPPLKALYITTDSAVSEETYADYNVYIAVAIDTSDNFYILDLVRFKDDPDAIVNRLISFAQKIAFIYGRLDNILFEKAGFQAFFKGIFSARRPDLPTEPVVPIGDKGHRADLVSELARSGRLFIRQSLQELPTIQAEWMNFPKYPHDDTLDPMGLLLQYLAADITVASVSQIRSSYLL